MYLARLLLTVALLNPLSVFAQNQQGIPIAGPPIQHTPNLSSPAATPSEPWRIIPNHELNPEWLQNPPETAQGQNVIQHSIPDPRTHTIVILPGGQILAENTCYSIRSYVVARDEKDSDSTHPVKSSTCQPARRYHVKNADAHPNSNDR